MKKVIIGFVIIGIALLCNNAYAWKANFNYGRDTYEKWDNILIVNSLGDETEESTFNYNRKSLGYNDYIPENAFKNNLYNEGYTRVYDFDNPNLDLTEVGYMGKLGDPRTYDTDYVLTSEYEKYSASAQDSRINNNRDDININWNRSIDNKNKIRDNRDDIDINWQRSINNENEIDRVEDESINRDNILQDNINIVGDDSKDRDKTLDKRVDTNVISINDNTNYINKVDTDQTNWNERQDTTLNDHDNRITNNTRRLDNHEGRIEDLEETQFCVRGELQFIREKNWTVGVYGKTDLRHPKINNEIGLNVIIGLGKSYTDREMEKMQKQLDNLSNMIEKGIKHKAGRNVEIKKVKTDKGYRFSIDKEATARLMKKW